ncbi:MAG: site-specific integrase [Lachnospiraceae bacterium]|nr:site-specific integrase [Lachnospiraceae bacterium]
MIIHDKRTGKYKVYLTDQNNPASKPDGIFRSRQEARNFELSITSFNDPENEGDDLKNISFERLVDAFIDEKQVRVRESTFIGYRVIIERFIRPYFVGKKADEIKPADIRAWQNGMLKLDYSPLYLHRVDSIMTGIFRYGVRFFGLERNPCDGVGGIGETVSNHINFWTLEEFTKFMTAVKDRRKHLIFNILYWTGLRLGELLALTPDDIDLEEKTISVTKSYRRSKGRDIISSPKTKKSRRVVYIPDFLVDEIKSYFSKYSAIRHDSRMFPVGVDLVRKSMTKAAKEAGVKRIKVHDLRHSHASLLINMNVTPLLVSERLGHEKVETTLNIYSHLYPDVHRKIAESLENEYTTAAQTTADIPAKKQTKSVVKD